MIKGVAYVLKRDSSASASVSTGADVEKKRFRDAFENVRCALAASAAENEIFAAHMEMLDDPMLSESVESAIAEGMAAEEAVRNACCQICAMFEEIDDEYLRARVDDVKDLCSRLEREVAGESGNPFAGLPEGTVIVADELFPSDTVLMDFSKIAGFVTARGSATSHVCIIARSKGIPVLVGYDISGISTGDALSLEDSGSTKVEMPSGVPLYCNAASVDDVRTVIEGGADGIGLFRTEFLFMQGNALPDEDRQFEIYRSALVACGGKPLTIRTLDIGGDKALPYLPMDREDNPFLGLRGIRFCLAHPEILRTQLRALVRAADAVSESNLRIMIPMVDVPEELLEVSAMLDTVKEELGMENVPLELGIMVETPAAVFNAGRLASCCDFFSLGTNDLTQYVMAADRGNSAVSYLYDSLNSAMRSAVSMVVQAAHDAGIKVGVCGEAASDPEAAKVFVELGVDSFSISRL